MAHSTGKEPRAPQLTIEETPTSILRVFWAERRWTAVKWLGLVLVVLFISTSLYQLLQAYFTGAEAYQNRTYYVSIMLILTYLLYPLKRKGWNGPLNGWFLVDLLFIGLVAGAQGYIFYQTTTLGEAFYDSLRPPNMTEIVIASAYMLLVLEATRRTIGMALVMIVTVFMAHAMYAPYFPGFLAGPPASWEVLVRNVYLKPTGIFGTPVAAMVDFVMLFIIFAEVLRISGAGALFRDVALSLTGRQMGGPAKSAVLSSGLMGMISGSTVANVVTTGSVTIPLMARLGYQRKFAGAVEAVASTGGAIMPPIMGAVAFIMAEFMGVSYGKIALAAVGPAFLYYLSAFMAVHFESKRLGLRPLDEADVPKLGPILLAKGHLLLPLFFIIALLSTGKSIVFVGFWGIVVAYGIAMLRPVSRLTAVETLELLESASRAVVSIFTAVAASGMIIGAIESSGLGWRFSSILLEISAGSLVFALLLAAVAAFILGMMATTSAVYIALAALVIPGIIKMGVNPMAAHMFALYFAVLAMITPPVAIAAFAAAGIAKADPMQVGWTASRIALPIYVVPFMFALEPALVMQGTPGAILLHMGTASMGIVAISAGMWGYLVRRTVWWERIVLVGAGFALIVPSVMWSVAGLIGLALIYLLQRLVKGSAEVARKGEII